MILHSNASTIPMLPTIAASTGKKSLRYLVKIYSEKPLPPGVGLTNTIFDITNCRAKSKKWSETAKKARINALTTKYLEVHEKKVAPNAFNQKPIFCFLSSVELVMISVPVTWAAYLNLRKNGSLKIIISNHLRPRGLTKRP